MKVVKEQTKKLADEIGLKNEYVELLEMLLNNAVTNIIASLKKNKNDIDFLILDLIHDVKKLKLAQEKEKMKKNSLSNEQKEKLNKVIECIQTLELNDINKELDLFFEVIYSANIFDNVSKIELENYYLEKVGNIGNNDNLDFF
ncbi:hypothetical protein OWM07_03255 [Deferribacter thermophilus]|uniref:hypothetical protein n=1 Tax=Deferribacter thermophilus TaxID=53573 RepID=UPI003C2919D6